MREHVEQIAGSKHDIVLLAESAQMALLSQYLNSESEAYDSAHAQLAKLFDSGAETVPEKRALSAKIAALRASAPPAIEKVVALGLANKDEEAVKTCFS